MRCGEGARMGGRRRSMDSSSDGCYGTLEGRCERRSTLARGKEEPVRRPASSIEKERENFAKTGSIGDAAVKAANSGVTEDGLLQKARREGTIGACDACRQGEALDV